MPKLLTCAAGVLVLAAATAARTTHAATQGPVPASCERLRHPDQRLHCAARAMFTVDLPSGVRVETVGGAVDYADFSVRKGKQTLVTIFVGNLPFLNSQDGPEDFGRGDPGEVRVEEGGRRRVRMVRALDADHVAAVLLLTSKYQPPAPFDLEHPVPPPWPMYVLVEIPADVPVADRGLAERIAGSVRAN
jgi:hypothetical protein